MVSTGDAVLHFAVEPRVFITGPECPDPRSWLALVYLEGSFVGSGESGCHIVHVKDIYEHLKREEEREVTDSDMSNMSGRS